ncbi:MAG: ABC transporter permease [Anaerolineae bacterium]|nr:ABC transporter permease [Anaerolineae bacterium]
MNDTIAHLDIAPAAKTPFQITMAQFRRHKLAVVSLILLVIFVVLSLLADQIVPYDPNDIDPRAANVTRGFPQPPTAEHVLGTDDLNRDLLSRALFGMRVSLAVGFFAMLIAISLGVAVGTLSGYAGGAVDNLLMRMVDVFLSVPSFILFLTLNSLLPPSIWTVVIILGAFSWMDVARLVRAEMLALKEREFVIAARSLGATPLRLVLSHVLPNALAPILVAATLSIPAAILSESTLSFLGLGVPPPNASLGNMLQDAKAWLTNAWWMWLTPGVIISLIVLAFNFVGDGLRDAFDPTLRR